MLRIGGAGHLADARLPTTKCDHKVKAHLCGGCDTLVDPAQTAAVQQLVSLAQQWDALGCSTVLACVPQTCQSPTGATCVYGGPGDCFGGCCVDTYP